MVQSSRYYARTLSGQLKDFSINKLKNIACMNVFTTLYKHAIHTTWTLTKEHTLKMQIGINTSKYINV